MTYRNRVIKEAARLVVLLRENEQRRENLRSGLRGLAQDTGATKLAGELQTSPQHLGDVIHGRRNLTDELIARIGGLK